MVVKIKNLKEGTHVFNLDEPVEKFELEDPFFDNLKISLKLQKLHNQIFLETKLLIKARFECDRCNSIFISNLETDYKMVYLFGNNPSDHESDNITYLPLDASEIKLDGDIRDYAMLAIPMKKLCKEDCKGLCPECGKNLNEGLCSCKIQVGDPRWLPLSELKNKIDTN
jgi:uncharacterized protein